MPSTKTQNFQEKAKEPLCIKEGYMTIQDKIYRWTKNNSPVQTTISSESQELLLTLSWNATIFEIQASIFGYIQGTQKRNSK